MLLSKARAPWFPEHAGRLVCAYPQNPVEITLRTSDRFANSCTRGGLPVIGRLQLVKQIKKDPSESSTLLMPNNHSVTVEDLGTGVYIVKVYIKITAMVKLFVQMDKNLGAAGELPPLTLSFHPDDDVAEAAAPL